jgi:hypothetical protein
MAYKTAVDIVMQLQLQSCQFESRNDFVMPLDSVIAQLPIDRAGIPLMWGYFRARILLLLAQELRARSNLRLELSLGSPAVSFVPSNY